LAGLGVGVAGLGLAVGLGWAGLGLVGFNGLEHAIPIRWRRLPIRWRVARRAANDLRTHVCRSSGAVLLRRRLCLPHGPRRSFRQRVLLSV